MKKLQEEGHGSTRHHDEIDEESLDVIENNLVIVQELMGTDKRSPEYQELLKKLPTKYQNKYHYLAQVC